MESPAIVVELKYNKSADTAIRQIREKHYLASLKDWTGAVVLVGVNYDKKTKAHQCVIERVESDEPKNVGKNVGKTKSKGLLRQEQILSLIREDNTISQRKLADVLRVSEKTIERDLEKLEHSVMHVGPTNGGEWKFVEE